MSTVVSINHKVREDRAARYALLREIEQNLLRFEKIYGAADLRSVKIRTALEFLDRVAKDPARTGTEKQTLFRRIAREIMEIVGAEAPNEDA